MSTNHDDHHDDDDEHDVSGGPQKKITFKDNKKLFIQNKLKGAGKFIWNNNKKQFLSRDGEDWTKISLFYVVFYAVLGFYTWSIMAIFMGITNTDKVKPAYTGKKSALNSVRSKFTPGMGVRPHIGSDAPEISFSIENPSEYVTNLDLFLEPFEKAIQNASICSQNSSVPTKTGCRYDVFEYLNSLSCSKNKSYGYADGQPCVLIKLNNIFDWKPSGVKYPQNDSYPFESCNYTNILPSTDVKYIYVTCKGNSKSDTENIKNMTFASPFGKSNCVAGIPFYYYPYENQPYYMQPLVVVKLNLTKSKTVNIACRAFAKDLIIDEKDNYGYTKFSVTVQN